MFEYIRKQQLQRWTLTMLIITSITFILISFRLFTQNVEIRELYLNQHGNSLEFNGEYAYAIKVWRKLGKQYPHDMNYPLKIVHNLYLQKNYTSTVQEIDQLCQAFPNSTDSLLHLFKIKMFIANELQNDSLKVRTLSQINDKLGVNIVRDFKSDNNQWVWASENFSEEFLKKWIDLMSPWLKDQPVSFIILKKDSETQSHYFYQQWFFNAKNFLENNAYEVQNFDKMTVLSPDDILKLTKLPETPFIWTSLKHVAFQNTAYYNKLELKLMGMSSKELLSFLEEMKCVVPLNYNSHLLTLNNDYQLSIPLKRLLRMKLKELKPEELEKVRLVLQQLST